MKTKKGEFLSASLHHRAKRKSLYFLWILHGSHSTPIIANRFDHSRLRPLWWGRNPGGPEDHDRHWRLWRDGHYLHYRAELPGRYGICPSGWRACGRQVRAVLADHHVTHIKIGMIGTMEIATALGKLLADYQGEVIYDPVLASTTGHSLLSCSSLAELSTRLISKVTVLTPNGDELAQLLGQRKIATLEEALRCAGTIMARHEHLRAVIVKGGHLEPDRTDVTDYLVINNEEVICSKRIRIKSANLHGTGCTYASAFAAFHCREKDYRKAFFLAAAYMDSIIKKSSSISLVKSGVNGPLVHAL